MPPVSVYPDATLHRANIRTPVCLTTQIDFLPIYIAITLRFQKGYHLFRKLFHNHSFPTQSSIKYSTRSSGASSPMNWVK